MTIWQSSRKNYIDSLLLHTLWHREKKQNYYNSIHLIFQLPNIQELFIIIALCNAKINYKDRDVPCYCLRTISIIFSVYSSFFSKHVNLF